MIALSGILTGPEVAAMRDIAAGLPFGDGRATAGARARAVKANDQALPSPGRDALLEKARTAIMAHPVFQSAARPRQMTPLLLSRYRAGQTYGLHVDDALMGGVRTDLSFTLFLSDPKTYDGGALMVEDTLAPRAIRLGAGDMILYPSSTLHRVAPVTRGERLAVVGWVESWVRGAAEREALFDLDRVMAEVATAAPGAGDPLTADLLAADLLAKVRANLLRLWAGA
jgi:PKHD-type hydroxylase